ncbi:LysR family transcripitonal regulator [Salmonella enterica subsp. enterica]|nr:LysR family transcripitonal regulator [Salmonella enterica subsp. enterica]
MVYYERAKDLLSNLDELEGLFQPDPASISGKIRVDIPPCLANSLIMPRLPTFLHQYPGIALELCSSDRQVDLLREDFDCVVRTEPLHAPGILTRPTWQTEEGELRQPTIPGTLWVSRKP